MCRHSSRYHIALYTTQHEQSTLQHLPFILHCTSLTTHYTLLSTLHYNVVPAVYSTALCIPLTTMHTIHNTHFHITL